jgi:excisionase family DNA binding protein
MKNSRNLSVPEAARLLRCTTKYVYDLLYSGSLSATKTDGRWKIPKAVIDVRLSRRRANGRH